MDVPHEKDWSWSLCEYDIKRVTEQAETIWSLKSSIQLSIPSENVTIIQIL
jgi:hypothetical protein